MPETPGAWAACAASVNVRGRLAGAKMTVVSRQANRLNLHLTLAAYSWVMDPCSRRCKFNVALSMKTLSLLASATPVGLGT